MKKFPHLDVPYQWKDYWTKYPHGYSIYEALCDWVTQVDEMVDNVNDWNKYLDGFVDQFDKDLQGKVIGTLKDWQESGFLDIVISEALQTQIDNVDLRLEDVENKTKGAVSLLDFESKKNGEDWQPALLSAINYCVEHGRKLILPPQDIKTSLIRLEGIQNLTIEFMENTKLIPLDGVDGIFMTIKNCENILIKNYSCDGKYRYYQGLMILEGNNNITIKNLTIKNISPILTNINPRNVNSVGLFIATHNNKNIQIDNVYIDGVTNNDNGIIGDSIGSSRGISFDSVGQTSTISCENIRLNNITIKNIFSEDGDGIDFKGSGKFHDIHLFNITTDNTQKRALKFQSIQGVTIDTINICHSDRSFNMFAGVSLYHPGTTIRNIKMDIKAVKGIEYFTSQDRNGHTLIENFNILMSNTELIDGSVTLPIDILDTKDAYINENVKFLNGVIKAKNPCIIRGYTRNVKMENIFFSSWDGNKRFVDFREPRYDHPDNTVPTHSSLEICNINTETSFSYALETVTFENCYFGNVISRDKTNPFVYLKYKEGIRINKSDFYALEMPTSGDYITGDYVRNFEPKRIYDSELTSWKVVKGWIRLTTGSSHEPNVDWVEDLILTN